MNPSPVIRLALPGKGSLEASTLAFLSECGVKVKRNNPRQYLASVNSIPDLEIVFQRATDIPQLVQEGDATFGITGYDILAEFRGTAETEDAEEGDDDDILILDHDLEYGNCRLVVAVPENWIDISTCADLWHLAGYYLEHKKRGLRIATKYPVLTGQFLRRHGITQCKIISPHGALEAAPLTETADLIVDLTETGTTLRENHLKLLVDGTVLRSQACLIGNTRLLHGNQQALNLASIILELIEARKQARNRSMLTAHLETDTLEEMQHNFSFLSQRLNHLVSGLEYQIAYSGREDPVDLCRYTISGVTNVGRSASDFLEIVSTLRSSGAKHINITPLTYHFEKEPSSVRALHKRLKRKNE